MKLKSLINYHVFHLFILLLLLFEVLSILNFYVSHSLYYYMSDNKVILHFTIHVSILKKIII